MQLTLPFLEKVALKKLGAKERANASSLILALDMYGARFGLDQPHRLAQFLAQVMHESGAFTWDREIWGPTPAQQRYDIRTDLGNTPERDGDGKKNMGRGPIQLTGGYNISKFYDWCVQEGLRPPDFRANPDKINTDPWEGLSAIWYWAVGNPTGKSLNRYADIGDVEMVTKKVNGGLNGFDDRLRYLARVSLALLGYPPEKLEKYQAAKGLEVDGICGPKTRAALHTDLMALTPGAAASPKTQVAPVVEEKSVAVTPPELDKPVEKTSGFWERIGSISMAGGGLGALVFGDWRVTAAAFGGIVVIGLIGLVFHARIIAAVRAIKAGIEA